MDNTLPQEALDAFAHSFGVSPEAPLVHADTVTLDDVRTFLIPRITALLDRNPGLLMHILYRVDVDEHAVKEVFRDSAPHDIPAHLADMLIDRQLRKLKIRRHYRENEE